MFKRLTALTLTLAMLLGLFAFSNGRAFAQRSVTAAPGAWKSAILIQNTGTASADVTIDFYSKDGGTTPTTSYTPAAIAAGKSVTIFVPSDVATLAAGQYSAIISSSAPVIASVQTSSLASTTAPWTAFAYEGVGTENTAAKLFFPANYKDYYGFYSELVIQNTTATATTATADFYNQAGTKIASVSLGTIGANQALTYPTSDAIFAALPSGKSTGIFGAVVTSSGASLAGIVNVWRTAPTNMTASYNAFTAGTTTLYAPSLTNNYYGFASALTIQNVDQATDAVVTVTYSNGVTDTTTLKPNAAYAFYAPANAKLPSGKANGSFAAKVTTVGGSIVGQVGYSQPPELNGGVAIGSYANYNCPPVASASVNIPNMLNNYYALFTNVTVQNTGDTATDITLTYETGVKWTITGVAPNGVANFLQLPNVPSNPLATTLKSSLSGVVSSSNAMPLVAVIQHNTAAGVNGYNAAKLPSDYLHVFTATPK